MTNENNLNNYFNYSKNIFSSIFFLIPLVLIYEILSFFIFFNQEYVIRNAAESIIKNFIYFSNNTVQYYLVLLLILLLALFLYNRINNTLYDIKPKFLLIMYIEGIFFGLLLTFTLNSYNSIFFPYNHFHSSLLTSFYLCIGAGIFEEFLFRFLLISFLFKFLNFFIRSQVYLYILIIFISGLLFSSFHYIGNLAYEFEIYTFLVRFIGGILLSLIYIYRGLGISSMTHFCYDFFLISIPLI